MQQASTKKEDVKGNLGIIILIISYITNALSLRKRGSRRGEYMAKKNKQSEQNPERAQKSQVVFV